MPFVRVTTPVNFDDERRRDVSDAIMEAMAAHLDVPHDDRFHIFSSSDARLYDRAYLGIARSDETLFVDVRLRRGRSDDQKRAFYATLARLVHERTGVSPRDVFITLSENEMIDWSFGDGIAQYAPTAEPAPARV